MHYKFWGEAVLILIILLSTSCSKEQKSNSLMGNDKSIVSEEVQTVEVPKPMDNPHFAKAQFYRWFTLSERPMNDIRIDNQMNILAKDILISSPAGEINKKQDYPGRMGVYTGWQKAHHVDKIDIKSVGDSTIAFEAKIRYQNIQPNGKKESSSIDYAAEVICQNDKLPVFSLIQLNPSVSTEENFQDAYATNKCMSAMHYWLGLLEELESDEQYFDEILSNDFVMNLSTGTIVDSKEKFKKWLQRTNSVLKASNYIPNNVTVTQLTETEFQMEFELKWTGVTKDDKAMTGIVRHKWIFHDNPNEAFPKILSIREEQVRPFRFIQ